MVLWGCKRGPVAWALDQLDEMSCQIGRGVVDLPPSPFVDLPRSHDCGAPCWSVNSLQCKHRMTRARAYSVSQLQSDIALTWTLWCVLSLSSGSSLSWVLLSKFT